MSADGSVLIVGGFGLSGCPENTIAALRDLGAKDLVVVSNNCGVDDFGLGLLLANRQITKDGLLLCRREQPVRAAVPVRRARGRVHSPGNARRADARRRQRHSGLLHRHRLGTPVADGKEVREFDGRQYLLERAITGDFALVKAWKGDHARQPRLPQVRAELQPAGRDGRHGHDRGGRGAGGRRRARPRSDPHPGHLRAADPRRQRL